MLLPVIKQCESAICTYPLPLEFCPIPNSIYLGYHKMEKTMAPHSSTLAWKISWTEEPGRLWSHGVTKSWTRLSDFTFTFHFHALQKEMATHSSALAWRIPGTEEPGGLLSMESHRVGHDWSDLAAAAAAMTSTKAPSLWSEIFYGYFYSKELIVWIFLVPISRKGITSINWMSSKKKRTNASITLNI